MRAYGNGRVLRSQAAVDAGQFFLHDVQQFQFIHSSQSKRAGGGPVRYGKCSTVVLGCQGFDALR